MDIGECETVSDKRLSEWLVWLNSLNPNRVKLGLGRIRTVLDLMGLRYPPYRVFTVGGTNGKGSVVAYLDATLGGIGMRVGAYTSPHLIAFAERITVDGVPAKAAQLVEAFEEVKNACDDAQVSLTYFEFVTVSALQIFYWEKVDVAVLEVGMGGRLDAVNAVDSDVGVITSIGLDHQAFLGPTRDHIGREKAGIARCGRPVVVGEREPPSGLLRALRGIGAQAWFIGKAFDWRSEGGRSWFWWIDKGGSSGPWPHPIMHGDHQLDNAACALAALQAADIRVPKAAFEGALRRALPGRQQVCFDKDGRQWLLDVAHNPQAAECLATELKGTRVAGKTYAIFGMLSDKDVAQVAGTLAPVIDYWLLAGLDGDRGLAVGDLKDRMPTARTAHVELCENVIVACERANECACNGDRIVVCGSFHTVAEALLSPFVPEGNQSLQSGSL